MCCVVPPLGFPGQARPACLLCLRSTLAYLHAVLPAAVAARPPTHAQLPLRTTCCSPQVRLSAVVERSDVEEVQALVDVILKSDPSAQENRKPGR